MLFKFGKFWKTLTLMIGSWIFFGIWGFEFTTITLLALILACNTTNTTKFL
jgi:hypothetical protein|tara:strand:- start:46 stop:198 length:153 start_codon:yes stop_codon:yes gene_type:complete